MTPVPGERGREYYVDELDALRESLGAAQSPELLMARVLQLSTLCRSLMNRLELVESVLGFDVPILSNSKEDILAVYWRAEDLARNPVHQADVIRDYTKSLLGMDEDFLQLVETYVEDREPWRIFLKAADALKKSDATVRLFNDQELSAAKQQLQVAQNMLEHRATLYVARRNGERAAYTAFPKAETSVHQRVFSRLPKPKATPGPAGPDSH